MSASQPCISIDDSVAADIRRHARSSMKEEICGILLGSHKDGQVRIDGTIRGEESERGEAHVTFTQETWNHIYRIKDEKYPDKTIVGWYHSHPGFGIFLSDYDLFIHKNFFNAPFHLAWVFDPVSDEEGCFCWQGEDIVRSAAVTLRHCGDTGPVIATEEPDQPALALIQETRRKKSRQQLVWTAIYTLFAAVVLAILTWFLWPLLPFADKSSTGSPVPRGGEPVQPPSFHQK